MYDDEDIYDRIQDARIQQAELTQQPIPAQRPYRLDAALLSDGDLIRVPDGGNATVGRIFPFGSGASATVECELADGSVIQLVLDDVLLLETAASRQQPYPRWTGAPA